MTDFVQEQLLGRMLGALSVTGPTSRTSLDQLENLAPRVLETAKRIGEEAEAWRFPETRQQKVETT